MDVLDAVAMVKNMETPKPRNHTIQINYSAFGSKVWFCKVMPCF